MNDIRMDLTQSDDAHFFRADRAEQGFTVPQNILAGIPVRETKIQNFGGGPRGSPPLGRYFQPAYAAGARAESVNEPCLPREIERFEYPRAASLTEMPFAVLHARGRLACTGYSDRPFLMSFFSHWNLSATDATHNRKIVCSQIRLPANQ